MTVKRRYENFETFYYVTFTCFRWIDLFNITSLYDNIYNWFKILLRYNVYNCGYVIMPNHLHMLIYTLNEEKTVDKIIGNGKRFMAYEIVKRLKESGNTELLSLMSQAVSPFARKKNKQHEVFEESFDCKEIITEKFIKQKLNYIHKNPVSGKWNLVEDYLDYKYSSARFYDLGEAANCTLFHYSDMFNDDPATPAESPQ